MVNVLLNFFTYLISNYRFPMIWVVFFNLKRLQNRVSLYSRFKLQPHLLLQMKVLNVLIG